VTLRTVASFRVSEIVRQSVKFRYVDFVSRILAMACFPPESDSVKLHLPLTRGDSPRSE
jgi:hypothetical protein